MRVKHYSKDDLQKAMDEGDCGLMLKIITAENVRKCPHFIFDPDHYKQDGTCLCFDKDHQEKLKTAAAIRHNKYKQVAVRQKGARP